MKQYYDIQHGEWISPTRNSYKLKCCDCGLVHRINFRLIRLFLKGRGKTIQFQMFRDNRATAAVRRGMKNRN